MATYNEFSSGGATTNGQSFTSDRVAFDGINRLMVINGTANLNVQRDLYSGWKLWAMENPQFLHAIVAIGGEPLPGGGSLGVTFILQNEWRVQIHNNVIVQGNLVSEEGSPYETTEGVLMATSVISALVERVDPPITNNARIFV